MNLNQTLLDAARDEVARKHGFSNFKGVWSMGISYPVIVEEAALLAMERLSSFYKWASDEQYLLWIPYGRIEDSYWVKFKTYDSDKYSVQLGGNTENGLTELELYEIFTTQQ